MSCLKCILNGYKFPDCIYCENLKSQSNEILLRRIEELEKYIQNKVVSCDELDEITYITNKKIESLEKNIKSKYEETNCEPICSSGFNVEKKSELTFNEMLFFLENKHSVRRSTWPKYIFIYMVDFYNKNIKCSDDTFYEFHLSAILANDWEVFNEERKN